MTGVDRSPPSSLLLLIAGAKGAIGSTLFTAAAALRRSPETVLPSLTTAEGFPFLPPPQAIHVAGWDKNRYDLPDVIARTGVLPEAVWRPYSPDLSEALVLPPPSASLGFAARIEKLKEDIREVRKRFPGSLPVFADLLPASGRFDLDHCRSIEELGAAIPQDAFPDIAYALAAVLSGIPVINFTPNRIEIPILLKEAAGHRAPVAGKDGKTGQTYLKVVLASAFKARSLFVDGWYSLNILGNSDGENLMNPAHAAEKLTNKTEVLEEVLGYPVGRRYGVPSHTVRIDYYPPRGDSKEAWDVIDFTGLFGLPMSIRVNLLGRDSILAAPLVLDLCRWMAALKMAGRSGPVPDLGFFFKAPVGEDPPRTFQDQLFRLDRLKRECREKIEIDPWG